MFVFEFGKEIHKIVLIFDTVTEAFSVIIDWFQCISSTVWSTDLLGEFCESTLIGERSNWGNKSIFLWSIIRYFGSTFSSLFHFFHKQTWKTWWWHHKQMKAKKNCSPTLCDMWKHKAIHKEMLFWSRCNQLTTWPAQKTGRTESSPRKSRSKLPEWNCSSCSPKK